MTSFTPFYVGGICKQCNTGEMYQYQEDATGTLRCGLCGELELNDEDEQTTEAEKPKRAYNRKKVA
jgi:Zn ribbon nucleic-acid-binding protein